MSSKNEIRVTEEVKITEMYIPGLTERVEALERRVAELLSRNENDGTSMPIDGAGKAPA